MSTLKKVLVILLSLATHSLSQEVSGEPAVDVDSRFFNIDFGAVGQNAAGVALGNLGSAAIGQCLGNTFGIGKRSIIMDRIVNKRSAQVTLDGVEPKTGSSETGQPEVGTRLFCLDRVDNNSGFNLFGNNNNNNVNCRSCRCSKDRRCYNTCDKCYGNSNSNYGSSSNNQYGSSSNNQYGSSSSTSSSYGTNCNSCDCSYNDCYKTCRKCTSNTSSQTNCNTCNCSYSSCSGTCNKCSYGNTQNSYGNTQYSYGNTQYSYRGGVNARAGDAGGSSAGDDTVAFPDA